MDKILPMSADDEIGESSSPGEKFQLAAWFSIHICVYNILLH